MWGMLLIIKTLIPRPDDRYCVQLEGPLGGSSGVNQTPEFHVGVIGLLWAGISTSSRNEQYRNIYLLLQTIILHPTEIHLGNCLKIWMSWPLHTVRRWGGPWQTVSSILMAMLKEMGVAAKGLTLLWVSAFMEVKGKLEPPLPRTSHQEKESDENLKSRPEAGWEQQAVTLMWPTYRTEGILQALRSQHWGWLSRTSGAVLVTLCLRKCLIAPQVN